MSLATTRAEAGPFRLAGFPLAHWAFALRVWLAMIFALAMAFWLQLDSASSAAVTVGILALPRRGQAMRKAAFRFAATIVGVIVSIAMTAIFTQSRDLFILAFAAWLAFTVYIAAFYDGTRAYGAVLSGYTVAIVAVTQIDSPQDVFSSATARLAVIALGIASVALVNDVLAAPTVYPTVRDRLRAAHQKMRAVVGAYVRGEDVPPGSVVELLGAITGTRLDIQAVASEAPDGKERAAAAGSAATAMIDALSKARGFAVMTDGTPPDEVATLRGWVEAEDHAAAEAALDAAMVAPERTPERVMRLALTMALIARLQLTASELAAMEAGRAPQRRVIMPIHRDREVARLASARVFLVMIISSAVLILSSWPSTSTSLLLVGVLAALSSTTPDARAFAKGAMITIPLAAVVGGVTEFFILDGADSFPLLALGLAPTVVLGCFFSLHPKTASIGSLMLIFTLVIFPPSNPQSYSAQNFITTAALAVGATWLFAALLYAFFPVSDKDRRRWMVNRARRDLLDAMAGCPHHAPDDMAYLGADRIVALARFKVGFEAAKRWRLTYTLLLSTLTIVVGRGQRRLDGLARGAVPRDLEAAARVAFARLETRSLQQAASALLAAVPEAPVAQRRRVAGVVADLSLAARMTEIHASRLRHLRHAAAA